MGQSNPGIDTVWRVSNKNLGNQAKSESEIPADHFRNGEIATLRLGLTRDDELVVEPLRYQESKHLVSLDVMKTSEPELIDVARGLWLWQVEYPEWPRGEGWDGKVISTCVESGGEIALLD